jgi:PD-(D/E)XK nuclease superfamily
MAALPQPEHSVVSAIYRSHEQREAAQGGHRAHLGASLIGHACMRYLWLTFRWARREAFDGRMLRLFNTGQRAESRFVEELRAIGCEVHDVDEFGRQFRVSDHGGHFGGSLDGAACGLPEAPKAWHVTEFKTHNAKSFDELAEKGVAKAKPMHHAQMTIYMGLTGMDRALYLAENKNTSALYSERVHFDPVQFAKLLERARQVITANEPPPRIHADPAWRQCKMCGFHDLCHGDQAPEVNCRTCAHSTPELDGDARWSCALHRADVDLATQRTGCAGHRYIPILLGRIGEQVGAMDEPDGNAAVRYRMADGREFVNGAAPAFASSEIAAAQNKAALGAEVLQSIKARAPGARVVA